MCYNVSVISVRKSFWKGEKQMKKIMALMVALSMTLSMASCGSSDDDTTGNSNETQSASASQEDTQTVTDTEEVSDEAAESEQTADESSQEETQSTDETSANGAFKASAENVFAFYNAPQYKPTIEELLPIADLAVAHYETARTSDWKAHLDTINYEGLINAPSFRAIAEFDEEQTENMTPGIQMAVYYVFYGLVCNYAEEKYGDEYKDDTLAEYIDSVTKAWNEITDEEAEQMVTYGFGAYRSFTELDQIMQQMDEGYERDTEEDTVNSDAVINLWIDECDKIGDDLYISLNIKIFSGDQVYDMPLVCAWSANGEHGIMSQTLRYFDTPYPGKTGAEIMAALEAGDPGIDPYADQEESTEDTDGEE